MSDDDLTELFEERAAIIEFDGKRPRIIAEALARAGETAVKRLQQGVFDFES